MIAAGLGMIVGSISNDKKIGGYIAQMGAKWNAYRAKPTFDGAFYSLPNGAAYLRKDGEDIYVDEIPQELMFGCRIRIIQRWDGNILREKARMEVTYI